MFLAFKSKLEDFEQIHNFIVKDIGGRREHVPTVSIYSYYAVKSIDSEQLEILNYYFKNKENAHFKIMAYIIL